MSTLGLTGTGGVVSCLAYVTLVTEKLRLTPLFFFFRQSFRQGDWIVRASLSHWSSLTVR